MTKQQQELARLKKFREKILNTVPKNKKEETIMVNKVWDLNWQINELGEMTDESEEDYDGLP